MKKVLSICLILCLSIFMLAGCSKQETKTTNAPSPDKLHVAVSFSAIKELTKAIGKDHVAISLIIPDGTEPHNFQPTIKNLKALNNAKLFIYNGFGLEDAWLDKVSSAADSNALVKVDASKGAAPILLQGDEAEGKKVNDPHLWLSLNGAELESKNIETALITADPAHKDDYEKNYQEFRQKLEDLKTEYAAKFAKSKRKDFITGHAAFGYLAKDFNLEQKSVSDALLSGEPSAKKLKELTDYCKANKVTTIFVEDMVSPKVSETLANEVNAKAVKIYTLESLPENMTYIDALKYNLEKIYASLN
ncbi:metal ABC transporter solute-binding protein, Zn/Mn family [Pectinatus brassicae]|uniref:Zinc transport system substrate-binding protein n=1 Tax=Pectinatus brassicae TaxID=862415 RepID=A0A840UPE8_9FIRM|nr:zinc ABC transporter substrate-binding protein [Pectinatus brassicae]MBB5336082.1 zinc transport system substrate-binding protein [Pectinatus brassicae]